MRIIRIIILTLAITSFFSCAKPEKGEPTVEVQGYQMVFEGQVNGFDGELLKSSSGTRLTDAGLWENGDQIFIVFTTPTKKVSGTAEYLADKNAWNISVNGVLAVGSNMSCQIVYIEEYSGQALTDLSIPATSAIYEDASATYSVNEERQIDIQANLYPKTSRVRFKSMADSPSFTFYGLNYFSSFNPLTGVFSQTNQLGPITISGDVPYTPYYYCTLSADNRRLYAVMGAQAFTRYCEDDLFQIGKSGQMDISSLLWREGLHFNVSGVEFTMLGAEYETYNSLFYLGETEVTEELYQTLKGNPSSSQLPQTNITLAEAIEFTKNLSKLLPFDFDLPFQDFYRYFDPVSYNPLAIKYDYSWNNTNCSSLQPVGTKLSMFGIYDTEGNASEWCHKDRYNFDCYGIHSSSYLGYNSTLPDGFWYAYNEEAVTLKAPDVGFRLAINIKYQ